ASLRTQLASAFVARDQAVADRNDAYAQRDRATLDRDAAVATADQLRVDLADARAGTGLDVSAERVALDRDRRLLEADRAALAAERAALEASVRESSVDAGLLANRQDLLAELSAAQADREALIAERAALVAERDRLATALAGRPEGMAPGVPTPPGGTTIREAGPEGSMAFLPGFDFARLENPDVIRRRLDEAQYPRWATVGRIEGDVLVLFQADRNGRVVRTAVPTPLGGGLDALAEEIVREMRFDPPVVDGIPTGLRSQVVVRFEL
ncbi:TonB family protein, partial [Rubrivirga sp.]|uniref:TonB family protein n=1 Tax=Rubrivirga sp. TaxID=1885344 RepID=UPI003C78A123